MSDNRFEALETKLLYQEDTIGQLDDALIAQQKQIFDLQLQMKNLLEQIKAMESQSHSAENSLEPPPPHY